MARTYCPECRCQISTRAATCPRCGCPADRGVSRWWWLVGSVPLIHILIAMSIPLVRTAALVVIQSIFG